jgi:hypothetical protein
MGQRRLPAASLHDGAVVLPQSAAKVPGRSQLQTQSRRGVRWESPISPPGRKGKPRGGPSDRSTGAGKRVPRARPNATQACGWV